MEKDLSIKLKIWRAVLCFICLLLSLTSQAQTLQCVIEHTIATNPDILETIHTLEAINEQVKQAQSGFFPVIDMTGIYGREASRNSNTNEEWVTLWRKELSLTLRQMLFDGFATRNEEIRSMSSTDAQAYRVYSQSEDLALAAAEAYISILKDKELLVVAEQNVAAHTRLAHMIKRRAEQKVGRLSDTYQANSRLAFAKTNLLEITQQYNLDVITFQRITGLCPECLATPPNPLDLPCEECEIIKLAMCYHPALKTAVAEIEAARAQHRAAFAPNFPRVDLLINATNSTDLDGFPGPNDERSAVIRMQWNLFQGGKDLARQRETAFNVKSATDVRDRIYRLVVERVSTSFNEMVMTAERAPEQVKYKVNAARTADAFYKLFMVGRTSLFDLLNAERERYISAQLYINNKYNNLIAKYRILNSMGQLNQYLGIPISCHALPCYRTLERAGTRYGPLELDYNRLQGGCRRH